MIQHTLNGLVEAVGRRYDVVHLDNAWEDFYKIGSMQEIPEFSSKAPTGRKGQAHEFIAGWYEDEGDKESQVADQLYAAIKQRIPKGSRFFWRVKPEIETEDTGDYRTGEIRKLKKVYTRFVVLR